jgi:sialic acid synthase SpsE
MSTWEELDLAVDTLRSNGCGDLTILQCTSEYPCPPEKTGLNLINEIRERFGTAVGFSDHTIGNAVPIAAVCFGATIIEKHFTLSKDMYGPDAKFSTTPDEMRRLVAAVRDVEKAIESVVDKNAAASTLGEMKYTFEKGIVAAKDLERGTKLERRHITCKKPAEGIPARFYLDMLGKTLKRDVKRDTSLQWDWLT